MAHTRWATHGPPSERNCHPHRSDPQNEFLVVHNGIITNYRELKAVLERKGYMFESDTDTEAIAKLAKYIFDTQRLAGQISFSSLVKAVIKELEGAFAIIVKSAHYPGEVVAARRGSPLLVGVKSEQKLKVDFVDVEFSSDADKSPEDAAAAFLTPSDPNHPLSAQVQRSQSRAFLSEDGVPHPIEFFVASDPSAVVEHTKRVLYLEDDDIAHIYDG
ncbi:glutamine--fructose-6-phosphate transaminase (isomerizing), partial [Gonapodya sp. JEL0774]